MVIKPAIVTATKDGFERLAKERVTVLAADRITVGVLTLSVGAVKTVVTVSAAVTPVQTTSSERSTVITSEQMEGLMSLGRDFTSLTRIMPGSTYEGNGNSMLGAASTGNFNGVSSNLNSINTDGVSSNTRNVGIVEGPLNMDAIQEVKVLDANYQAEYGKVAGSIIDVVSKSGTRDYHGTVSYYLRNEDLNANDYFSNRAGAARARYRYNTINASFGGPIFGPGPFHSLRDKLFFFFSEDYEPNSTPNGVRYYTMPTALERTGDFSQSVNSSGQLYTVLDPITGQPFAGNKVPASRINTAMQATQAVLPLPNFTNRAVSNGNYNYVISDSSNSPARQESLRLDYDASEKLHLYFRGSDLHNTVTGRTEPGINASWMNGVVSYNTRAPSLAMNATYTFNPHIVNELSVGAGLWYENSVASQSTLNQFSKSVQGIGLGQLYPANNPLDLMAGMYYGIIPNAPSLSYDGRFPLQDFVLDLSGSDGLSYVVGNHNLKFGIYADNVRPMAGCRCASRGHCGT
jgi:hypothetical protein